MPLFVNVSLIVKLPVFVYVALFAVVNTFCSTILALITSCNIFVVPTPEILLASVPAFKLRILLFAIPVVETTLSAFVVNDAPLDIVTLF